MSFLILNLIYPVWDITNIFGIAISKVSEKKFHHVTVQMPNNISQLHRWWLILCVNLAGPQSAQVFGQTLFWLCVWGCFGMRVAFESVRLNKADCSPCCGAPHSINWRSNRTKTLALWVRNFSSAWLPSSWTLVFPCLQTWTEIMTLPGSLV